MEFETQIETKELSVHFGKKQVLRGVDLCAPARRITAVIGQSGCGKSTLLKSLNRIAEEEGATISGGIYLAGRDTEQMSRQRLRRDVGLVFQQPVIFPCSIEKNMRYALDYHFHYTKEERAAAIRKYLELAELYEEVKDRMELSAAGLSGGQQQRLSIARALSVEPKVLLLDEPCSALDLKNTMAIEAMLCRLKERYTILIVTHNLAQARRIADRIILMDGGEIVETGDAGAFFAGPGTELGRAYIHYMEV